MERHTIIAEILHRDRLICKYKLFYLIGAAIKEVLYTNTIAFRIAP